MFKDTPDLRNFLPQIHTNFDYDGDLKVYVAQAVARFIEPYFGAALLTDLQTKYAADTLVLPIEAALFNKLQHAAAYYMYMDLVKFNAFNMTPRGPQESISADGNSRPAENYKVNDARRMASQRADQYLDEALSYAEAQINESDNFAAEPLKLWRDSEAYKEMLSLLVWSYDQLKEYLPSLRSRRLLFAARAAFLRVQKSILAPNLGEELQNLIDAVQNRHTATLSETYSELLAICQPVLIYRGMLGAIPALRIEIEEGGLHFRTYDGPLTKALSTASDNALRHYITELSGLATAAEADLQKYLQASSDLTLPEQDLSAEDGENYHGPTLYGSGGSAFL